MVCLMLANFLRTFKPSNFIGTRVYDKFLLRTFWKKIF